MHIMRAISPDTLPSPVLEAGYLLGKRIAAVRKARGLSQRAVSEGAGVGRSTLVEIEHGSPKVQFVHWLLVLDYLGVLDSLTQGISATEMGLLSDAIPRSRAF